MALQILFSNQEGWVKFKGKILNPLTLINTISIRQMMRIKKYISLMIFLVDPVPNSQN